MKLAIKIYLRHKCHCHIIAIDILLIDNKSYCKQKATKNMIKLKIMPNSDASFTREANFNNWYQKTKTTENNNYGNTKICIKMSAIKITIYTVH